MEVFRTLPSAGSHPVCGMAIGNFDGVHLGHQAIVAQLREAASGLPVTVMTFEPHPREFFATRRGVEAPPRISTETDRLQALASCGVDAVCIVPFDEAFATMQASEFVERVIGDSMQAQHLMVGDDFRFGAGRSGDYNLLRQYADQGLFALHQMPTLTNGSERISSSLVRQALAGGDFERVHALLGRPYFISGEIIRGKQLGRTIGFPTMNVGLSFTRPALSGVFVVQVHGLGEQALPGVASLGVRPAVESNGDYLLEVHLFDFDRSVYGEQIGVQFLHKLRDEAHYDSLELLTQQIETDAQQARDYFASTGN